MRRPGEAHKREKFRRKHQHGSLSDPPAKREAHESDSTFFVNEDSTKHIGWRPSESTEFRKRMAVKCSADMEEAVMGVRYIAEKLKNEDDDEGVRTFTIQVSLRCLQLNILS